MSPLFLVEQQQYESWAQFVSAYVSDYRRFRLANEDLRKEVVNIFFVTITFQAVLHQRNSASVPDQKAGTENGRLDVMIEVADIELIAVEVHMK